MIQTGYFLIKQITKKKTIINLNLLVELCWNTLFHDRMSIRWSLDAKKTFYFKLMLQIREIDIHLPHPH